MHPPSGGAPTAWVAACGTIPCMTLRVAIGDAVAAYQSLGVEEPFVPAEKAHPGILTHDLDAVQARFIAADVEVRPDDPFPGFRRSYVDDCFGNRLEFLQPGL
jgi:hypothetical protein